ncbi:unnamed protein product [Callosobruchus maculatus]|uniref:Uncharacterized protein n=1 Tax=Callosobruchus maculatus TaxID=64391 RepID=A0A653CEP7_CALMS|nr:unnamed protein product [Callosobruchus maculatus]
MLETSVAQLKADFNVMKHTFENQERVSLDIVQKGQTIESMLLKLEQKDKRINTLEIRLDEMDQACRSANLRIFNLKEVNDFEVCHRVGRKEEGKNRPIFIKLVSIEKRNLIYGKKKHLKSTGVVVKEDLTSFIAELLRKTIEKIGLRNVWTENGKIFAIVNRWKIIVRNLEDLSGIREFNSYRRICYDRNSR